MSQKQKQPPSAEVKVILRGTPRSALGGALQRDLERFYTEPLGQDLTTKRKPVARR